MAVAEAEAVAEPVAEAEAVAEPVAEAEAENAVEERRNEEALRWYNTFCAKAQSKGWKFCQSKGWKFVPSPPPHRPPAEAVAPKMVTEQYKEPEEPQRRTPAFQVSSGHQMRFNLADREYIEWHDCLTANHYWCVDDIKEHLMQSQWEMFEA